MDWAVIKPSARPMVGNPSRVVLPIMMDAAYQLVQSGQAFFVYSTGAGGTVSSLKPAK